MGTKISELLEGKETSLDQLKGKVFTVDAHNILYQFLSNIRQRDGSYLTDSKGNVTSHLIGLFSRLTKLMMNDMNFIFCFDGKVPELKFQELAKRKEVKQNAEKKYKEAEKAGDEKEMLKYAKRSVRLTPDMIKEAKKLISALGQVCIDAPSEGEAQASHIVKKGDAYAVISQDADCFLFGSPKLVKNLTLSGKRKLPGQQAYVNVYPEIVNLSENLDKIGISQDELIALSILVGTDFNPGGIKGIGPKNALKLIKEHKMKAFEEAKWNESFNIDWKEIFDLIKNMDVSDDYEIKFDKPNEEEVLKLLVEEHDFETERVKKSLKDLIESKKVQQKGLSDFI